MTAKATKKITKASSEDFGFTPAESEHHFVVTIPKGSSEKVMISEHYSVEETGAKRKLNVSLGKEDTSARVFLDRPKWNAIADHVRADFNQRLKKTGLKAGKWKAGNVQLSRLFGKEIVLLAWAIEDADPSLIPIAIKNWLGLTPEERWWLFTMTNAATGHAINGRNKGWRKAVRYALTENPVSDYRPEPEMALFKVMEEELSVARKGLRKSK